MVEFHLSIIIERRVMCWLMSISDATFLGSRLAILKREVSTSQEFIISQMIGTRRASEVLKTAPSRQTLVKLSYGGSLVSSISAG